ncbi:MAG: ABC transporter ATP-binding protein [Halosimplex sp.]
MTESRAGPTGSVETAAPVDDPILEVRDASVSFDMDRGESRVLDSVNIDIQRQEILGVVGESGSGKSMFASALLDAVVDPGVLEGEITYNRENGESVDVTSLEEGELRDLRWEEISMVFQGAMSSFNPTMKVRGHFEETLDAHEMSVEEGMDHARELLSELYLEPERVFDSYPHELSGGMQQRALIALSLLLDPEVLVMDEPTAALDLLMQRSILTLLQDLQESYDLTVVFITHDLPLVTGLCDRLAVLYAFEFVEVGPTGRVVDSPSHPYTRALLKAVPHLDMSLDQMEPIEGAAPDPVNVPAGCSFHPRCPLATEECEAEDPPFYETADTGHDVACHHWERALEEIPLEKESTGDGRRREEPTRSDDVVLSLDDVSVRFETETDSIVDSMLGRTDLVHAVDGVDLDLHERDVVALVGESGCGKTTLGKTAIGAQRPTDGVVSFRDQDIWAAKDSRDDLDVPWGDIRRSLQIIHQDPGSALNPNRSVKAILSVPLQRWQPEMNAEDREARIHGMLQHVGMTPSEDYANRYPHQLSGGEKQRVALVRALLMNPDVILADEAVSALDVSLRVEMMNLMLDLQEEFNTSYIFVSHDLANARYLAESTAGRIAVMYLGEIVEIGRAEDIIDNPKHPYTKILRWSTADLDRDETAEEPPLRGIDIPDPVNPPTGCHFRTRCPEAREACKKEIPALYADSEADDETHGAACFREYPDDHPYWDSEPVEETDVDLPEP